MGNKLYVGNLPYTITLESLSDAFSVCGTVESVKIITDRETGRSRGFGFIEMASGDQAQEAIEKFNGNDFNGRPLTVNVAKPQTPKHR